MTPMNTGYGKLAFGAMLTAIAVALVYISAVAPTARVAVVAVAGISCAVALIETGMSGALMVYAASSILALLIVPARDSALGFAFFFGLYPIVKSLCERIRSRVLEWGAKIVFFYIALTLMFWLAGTLFMSEPLADWLYAVLYAGGGVVFVLYDIALTRVITIYVRRVSKRLGGKGKRG